MGGSSKKQTVGYRYYFDIHMGLGLPIDELTQIRADNKTAWSGSISENGQININAPQLFGGDSGEGGLQGTMDVLFGQEDQGVLPRLKSMLGGIVPAFRGVSTAFYSGLITSVNPYPKSWELLRRGGNRLWGSNDPWYPERQFIWLADRQIKAMNPVHILYQVHTSDLFRGWPRAWMDDAAWKAAADAVYEEGLGLCIEWKKTDSFATFRDTICDHISAEVYDDRTSGLCSIRLLRDDYNVDDLPLFTPESGLLEITEDESSSTDSVPSELLVKYTDAITGESQQVRAVNAAVAARNGGRSSETVEYVGAPTGEIAGRLATRDLRTRTSGIKRFKLVMDRRASAINPAEPFCISDPKRGIDRLVVRAGRIEDGTLSDGRITITALQDVFGLPANNLVAIPPTGWSRPDRSPQPITTQRVVEAPYMELAERIDQANLSLLDGTEAFVSSFAIAPSNLSLGYDLTDRTGYSGDFVTRDTGDWCPSGMLTEALTRTDTSVQLTDSTRFNDIENNTAAIIGDEIIRIDSINTSNGIITIARGCADTVPTAHDAGERVWFYDGFEAIDDTQYTSGTRIQAKLLTRTSEGTLDDELASTASIHLNGRQGLPYPPGRVRINNFADPDTITGDITLTWAHRDRINQADQIIDTEQSNIGPESGVTYSARLLRTDTKVVLSSQTNITATEVTLNTDYEGSIIIELWSVNSGQSSTQRHSFTVDHRIDTETDNTLGG